MNVLLRLLLGILKLSTSILVLIGIITILFGILLSFTIIGLIIGIPLIFVGILIILIASILNKSNIKILNVNPKFSKPKKFKCKNCKNNNSMGSKFCSKCGEEL